MKIYRKEIQQIDTGKKMEYVMSNGTGVYMSGTVIGENTAPYHGLFIKQKEQAEEIFLSKVIEEITIGSNQYHIYDIETSEKKYNGAEYLETFERYPYPKAEYIIEDVKITKSYIFSTRERVLCISYKIENKSKNIVNIKILPCITKREPFTTKRESMLKLNSIEAYDGCKITMSIKDNENLYIKSNNLKYKNKASYINGINYNHAISDEEVKTYIEDVFVPGEFSCKVKANTNKNIELYVSLDDIYLADEKYELEFLQNEWEQKNKLATVGIDGNYHELKALAISAKELSYIDNENKKIVLLKSLPNIQKRAVYLKQLILSIEGNYLILNKYKEAYRILNSIKYTIEKYIEELSPMDYYEVILMYIYSLMRYLSVVKCKKNEKEEIVKYITENVEKLLEDKELLDDKKLISIDNKKYLRLNSYWYNALKIYVDLGEFTDSKVKEIYSLAEAIREEIINKFWDEEKKVLKCEISEPSYATADMLYAINLTYPVVYDGIALKILDTCFKELYTPYGIRLGEKTSRAYDGYVYPHLTTLFISSNLRQNGVTRATQKITYNLVKELLAEISKQAIGTVKYKYSEKTKNAYGLPINTLTNAELIRLYNMLT
ncbi:MAG: glycogen debranching enzyme N-terminal domain-containing protein [Clostridia bacterium]|nr:glycogen debranching enzyme N-terminal domain-containing protein [Clostridia bacterium]